jgi:hypothetical protein
MLGRDPRLGQPPDHEQLAQVAGVGAVGLGALRVAAPRGSPRGLRQVNVGADRGSSSTTNRQPVVASRATSSLWPAKRLKNRRTSPRSAGETRARLTSPVSVSIHSAVSAHGADRVPLRSSSRGLLELQ